MAPPKKKSVSRSACCNVTGLKHRQIQSGHFLALEGVKFKKSNQIIPNKVPVSRVSHLFSVHRCRRRRPPPPRCSETADSCDVMMPYRHYQAHRTELPPDQAPQTERARTGKEERADFVTFSGALGRGVEGGSGGPDSRPFHNREGQPPRKFRIFNIFLECL